MTDSTRGTNPTSCLTQTWVNDTFGFRFQYPTNWVQIPGQRSLLLRPADGRSFVASDGGKSEQVYSPALTLVMAPRGNTEGQTPSQVFQGFKALLSQAFRGYEFHGEESFELESGQQAYEIRFDLAKGGRTMTSVMAYVVTPEYIFMFDGCSLKSSFIEHEADLRAAIRSLRID